LSEDPATDLRLKGGRAAAKIRRLPQHAREIAHRASPPGELSEVRLDSIAAFDGGDQAADGIRNLL
jgi:hypothetical protein